MPNNLFHGNPPAGADEHVEVLARSGPARIERIVSRGHVSPPGFWYDQTETEWVAVLAGRARLAVDDGTPAAELGPGDWLEIPAGRRHRVDWTEPDRETIWLAVFYPAGGE